MSAQKAQLEKARADFRQWCEASMEYEPPHLCALGEDDPEPEHCIPCNLIRSAKALVIEERIDAATRLADGLLAPYSVAMGSKS